MYFRTLQYIVLLRCELQYNTNDKWQCFASVFWVVHLISAVDVHLQKLFPSRCLNVGNHRLEATSRNRIFEFLQPTGQITSSCYCPFQSFNIAPSRIIARNSRVMVPKICLMSFSDFFSQKSSNFSLFIFVSFAIH